MHDMHCHLTFMANGEDVAAEARTAGALLFANTVTPADWRDAKMRFSPYDNVIVGFGMHPWWVGGAEWPDGGIDAIMEELDRENPPFIGEVGLDFGKRHVALGDLQVETFRSISQWAGNQQGKVLSIHSVHAAADTLNVLESTGALASCTCIFHWFSGPSDQLKRAIQSGCLFSVGPRMLATGKGREYVKAIPATQLLLETDEPAEQGQPFSFAELHARLEQAANAIAAIKGEGALEVIDHNTRALFSR